MARPARKFAVATEDETVGLRRSPTQHRSRTRVERLLAAAAALIGEGGSDAMRMSDVAKSAGVSIGSLYQYFPDKAALIRTLAERYNAEDRACIEAELVNVRSMAGLRAALDRLIDTYYEMFLAEPVRRDIWSGTQADKTLHDVDLADNRANAALLTEVLVRLKPRANPAGLAASAFLLWHLAGATVRLAVSLERAEGNALVAAVKRMLLRDLAGRGRR